MIVIGFETDTVVVVTVKAAPHAPEATVTLAGTEAVVASEDDRATTAPAGGAGPLRLTTPEALAPPATAAGVTVTCERTAGVTVRAAGRVAPLNVAEIVTGDEAPTPFVVTLAVAEVAPAETTTPDGTVATVVSELASKTTTPPTGAAWFSSTVAVTTWPDTAVGALSVS